MLATCISTVLGLRTSVRAILALVCSSAISWRIFSLAPGQVAGLKTTCRFLNQALDKWFAKRL